jgi:hypothetical protein
MLKLQYLPTTTNSEGWLLSCYASAVSGDARYYWVANLIFR